MFPIHEMVEEGLISREEAVNRVVADQLDQLLHPIIDPQAHAKPLCQGLPASPGAASGRAVFDPDAAERRNAKGEAFEIEYLSPSEGTRMPDWELNLEKLGITLKIRSVDFALYRRRLEEFDFDMITIVEGDFTLPSPTTSTASSPPITGTPFASCWKCTAVPAPFGIARRTVCASPTPNSAPYCARNPRAAASGVAPLLTPVARGIG